MRLSKCTLIVPNTKEYGKYIVYNTRTQALFSIAQALKQDLEALPAPTALHENEEMMQALYKSGIIVHDKKEDAEQMESFLAQIETRADTMSFEITVLTTLGCNFACPYCFEEGAKKHSNMTEETCKQFLTWIMYQTETYDYQHIHITFYGGEPLMNTQPIYFIAEALQEWCKQVNRKFSFGMITNGYLIDPDDIDTWIRLGMNKIRVTVDGDKASHDSRRPLLNGAGTFDTIMDNIGAICDKDVDVSITGNYDEKNVDAMIRLLDFLDNKGLLHKLERIGFSPILPRFTSPHVPGGVEMTECMGAYTTVYYDMDVRLRNALRERNMPVETGMGYFSCALTARHNAVVIAPEGEIYKCPTMVGYPQFAVGHVQDMAYNAVYEKFLKIQAWRKCDPACAYIPVCSGGCRFMAFVQNGNFDEPWCVKESIEKLAPSLIQLDYEACCKAE